HAEGCAMRRRNILIKTLACAVVVVTIGGVAYTLYTRTQADRAAYPSLYAPLSVVCPRPTTPMTGAGYAAIHPRNDCTPAFTQQDVRTYLAQVRGSLGGFIGFSEQPIVTRVVFLTIAELLVFGRGHAVSPQVYPEDMLVCYAELRGRF